MSLSQRIEEIEARLKAATPGIRTVGPWEDGSTPENFTNVYCDEHELVLVKECLIADAEIFAHAPADLAYLIATVKEQQEKIRTLDLSRHEWMSSAAKAYKQIEIMRETLECCSKDDSMAVDPSNNFDVDSANEWKKILARTCIQACDAMVK